MIKRIAFSIIALIVLLGYERVSYLVMQWGVAEGKDIPFRALLLAVLPMAFCAIDILLFTSLALSKDNRVGVIFLIWLVMIAIGSYYILTLTIVQVFNVPEYSPGPAVIWLTVLGIKAIIPITLAILPKA